MASSTSQYAAGDLVHRTTKDSKDESTTISGRKRKTLFLHEEPRPLFVAEAEFRAAKVFTRVKKCMLVLTGAEVLVLNVAALEAAEAAAAGGDMSLAVLRLISYRELLEVSICGSSSLKIEYGDSSDKPKLASASLFGAVAAAGTASSEQQQQPGGLASSSASTVELYGGASSGGAAGMSGAGSSSSSSGAASIRVTFDYFTLAFKDPATAQEAAAAMLFQRAQYAAMRQWLYQGLHAGLSKCREVLAVPAQKHKAGSSGGKQQQQQQQQQQGPAAAAGFSWTVSGRVPAVLSPDGSSTNLAASAGMGQGLTVLRQRMASMNLSMGGAPPLASLSITGGGVPTLVSDPEPSWLHPDNKQRFLNAKPTLEASREQAVRTHRWRQRCNVDSVLTRPCDGFEKISATFPTYTLLDNSPDGHAVVLMKVGCIKDLCDLVFNPPDGVGVTLEQVEQALALFNEYLVHVAAPNPLPAGFQVQFYDMEGFKLSYVMGDMLTLFKLLVRFGHYYPERLHQALVINAPAWFSYPWKLMNAFLDANTSAKVVVVGSPKSALATIAHHMGGIANVPAAWGGKNTTPIPEYPAHRRMIEFARRLNAGEQPLQDVRRQQD
ncbi:hypothetical protein OEZ85_005030 [Tetradesmus obliquus]|uniref:CRAL-TRIO domain-containing protein n=1 Tax=Tetradesmus obliquus TaxID=3088 RepID=A0ABY8UHC6_TETOB|nr:hypothetical protein OEZ85_005030 [Tetradesmus obliquus]